MAQDENLAAVVTNAAQDIGSFIRAQREAAQVSVRQLAEKAGVSNPYLSQIERGLRKPSADVLNQIAKALRVSAEVLYVRAGMLEPSEASDVRDAVIADTAITERQKQALLEIYASFVDQNAAGVGAAAALAAAPDDGASADVRSDGASADVRSDGASADVRSDLTPTEHPEEPATD
jgi:transcriptional regulator with XRE-family HTH domain